MRVARNRSLVEEDLRLSRQSARQIEAGEMTLAKPALQRFIEAHPLAHESRKVLVMLLIADRQLSEASEVLAEGMQLVPHRVAFKKLYARLQFGGDPSRCDCDYGIGYRQGLKRILSILSSMGYCCRQRAISKRQIRFIDRWWRLMSDMPLGGLALASPMMVWG